MPSDSQIKTIGICGCGWIGLPLGRRLVDLGFEVKGSTTRPEEEFVIRAAGMASHQIICAPYIQGRDAGAFFQCDLLVLTIPFKRDLLDPWDYFRQIQSIIKDGVIPSPVRSIIFTSSTSVYSSCSGEVSEETLIEPRTDRARALRAVEQFLLEDVHLPVTILRLGGLYGGDRRLGQRVIDKGIVENSDQPVNLVHRDDVLSVMTVLIRSGIRNEILNVVSDAHPLRRDLFSSLAVQAGRPEISFSPGGKPSRIVQNRRLKQRLGFVFAHPDPMPDVGHTLM